VLHRGIELRAFRHERGFQACDRGAVLGGAARALFGIGVDRLHARVALGVHVDAGPRELVLECDGSLLGASRLGSRALQIGAERVVRGLPFIELDEGPGALGDRPIALFELAVTFGDRSIALLEVASSRLERALGVAKRGHVLVQHPRLLGEGGLDGLDLALDPRERFGPLRERRRVLRYPVVAIDERPVTRRDHRIALGEVPGAVVEPFACGVELLLQRTARRGRLSLHGAEPVLEGGQRGAMLGVAALDPFSMCEVRLRSSLRGLLRSRRERVAELDLPVLARGRERFLALDPVPSLRGCERRRPLAS
jgi:hypothetical protein